MPQPIAFAFDLDQFCLLQEAIEYVVPKNHPFLICAEPWLRAVVPDRHTFFDARRARQKPVRFLGIDVP